MVPKLDCTDAHGILNTADGFALVGFTSEWNTVSNRFLPMFEKVSGERQELPAFEVNINDNPELASHFGVRAVPDLLLLKNGKPLSHTFGIMSEDGIKSWLAEFGL